MVTVVVHLSTVHALSAVCCMVRAAKVYISRYSILTPSLGINLHLSLSLSLRTMDTLSRSYHGGLMPGVMADQRKALADTTELTETVYFVHPTGIRTINLCVSSLFCEHYQD